MGKIRREISLKNITQLGDVDAVKKSFNQHLHLSLMKDRMVATTHDYYSAVAYAVRDKLVENWIKTQQCYYNEHPKVGDYFCNKIYCHWINHLSYMINGKENSSVQTIMLESN